jgi:hypothetical protein
MNKKYLEKLEEDRKELLREWYSIKLPEEEMKWLIVKRQIMELDDYISRYKRDLDRGVNKGLSGTISI